MSIDRRTFVTGTLAVGAIACIPLDRSALGRLAANLRIIEARAQGTLGVEFYDTASGLAIGHNRDLRFGHASSFKTSLAAMVLARDATGLVSAERRVTWSRDELLSVSPFTTERVNEGATLRELAEAMQKFSDNTGANILLREVGGPAELTDFWRYHGDEASRLDRTEPSLNNVPQGEERDTTTPRAMARTMARILYGDVLPEEPQAMLRQWMVDTGTGVRRVRKGLPPEWRAGDKTGTATPPGVPALTVDIGFVEPTGRAPITFAAYFRSPEPGNSQVSAAEAVLAEVGGVLGRFARALPA